MMILFTMCVVAVFVGLFFYLRDMGLLGGPNRDPIRGGVVPETPPLSVQEYIDKSREERLGSSTWEEVKAMRDIQQGITFDVPFHECEDDIDDCGPDCE